LCAGFPARNRNDGAGRESLCGKNAKEKKEMMALVGDHYAEEKKNHCAGREALVCGGPNF
jgi:hypothetical protein